MLTFEPHPREFFAPDAAPTRLTSLREKLELLAAHGVDHVHVQRFARAFAALAPEAFVEHVLVRPARRALGARRERFPLRCEARGRLRLARRRPRGAHGFALEAMPTVERTAARAFELGGPRRARPRRSARAPSGCSAAPTASAAASCTAAKLGRALGFPTANVLLKHNRPPLGGIFAVRVRRYRATSPRDGVASLGVRPTVHADGRPVLEVHLFDFDGDLYGAHLRVRVPGEAPRRGALRGSRHAEGADRARLRRRAGAAHYPLTRFCFSWPTTRTR